MDELIKFVEMNQEPLVEIMSAMELPPEITEREVSWRRQTMISMQPSTS